MLNKKNLFQGRTMVEMLGVLAIIGILSVGGVLGYRYAMNLHKANQIIYDVSMGMKLVSTSKKTGGFALDFEPTSPYTYTGFKMIYPERRLGFVVTHDIEVPVCEILLGKQSDTSFYIYQADENAGTFQLMDGCVANQAYYFASVNTSDAIACNCGNHAHCTDLLTGNCECDSGYTMNANGKCISDSCDDASASGPGAVQDEECCVDSYGWLWLDGECYCPFPTTWDSDEKDCVGECPSTVTALSQLTRKACCEKKHYTWNAALRRCDCPENYVWNDFVKGCVDSSMRPDRPEDATDEETCKMWGWYWDAKTSKCTCPLGEEWDSATSACVVCDMLSPPSYPEDVTAKVCCEKWNFEWNVEDGLCGCPSLYTWNNTTKQCENLCGMPEQPEDVATQECCESFEWEWRDNACHCPESAPNYSVSGGVGLCCPKNYINVDGQCARESLFCVYDSENFYLEIGCDSGQYCYVFWTDEQCTPIQNNSLGRLYGKCLELDTLATLRQGTCPTSDQKGSNK